MHLNVPYTQLKPSSGKLRLSFLQLYPPKLQLRMQTAAPSSALPSPQEFALLG